MNGATAGGIFAGAIAGLLAGAAIGFPAYQRVQADHHARSEFFLMTMVTRDRPAGSVLSATDVTVQSIPRAYANAAMSRDRLWTGEGQILAVPARAGDPAYRKMFVSVPPAVPGAGLAACLHRVEQKLAIYAAPEDLKAAVVGQKP